MTRDPDSPEHLLVDLAQSGDEEALATLFDRCAASTKRGIRQRLSPAIRRKVSDSDVFQEVLVTAARRLDTFEYRGEGSFQRWIGGIAEYTRRDAIRRHTLAAKRDVRAEVSRDARPETRHAVGRAASPSRMAMAQEMRQHIAEVLAEMPEDYRTAIQLLERRRVSLVEAGELMGRSANAVKKLHARALSELAHRLGLDDEEAS